MPIILYTTSFPNPSARAVETVIRILKLDVENREVNVMARENCEPWFVRLNPARDIPVLDDNGYILNDSHAIISYLFTVYAPKNILEQYYPTDPKQRGIINSRWHFINEALNARMGAIFGPLFLWTDTENDMSLETNRYLVDSVDFLDKILEGKEWLAGDRLTVADISAITTIDLVELLVPLKYYKNVSAWTERVRMISPFYDVVGIEELIGFIYYFKNNIPYDAEGRWHQIRKDLYK